MIQVKRNIENCGLNGFEYLLDGPEPEGEVMRFANEDEAWAFLKEHGAVEDDRYLFTFEEAGE